MRSRDETTSEDARATKGTVRRQATEPAASNHRCAGPTRVTGAPQAIALQRIVGNAAMARLLGERATGSVRHAVLQREVTDALPSIDHLSAMQKVLMTGVLAKTSVDDAVGQIYENMFALTGWRYNASTSNVSGASYVVTGQSSVGMCESFRNAFAEAIRCYEELRTRHPNRNVREGALTVSLDNSLAQERFCTRSGLTLMGGLKGNVYLQVDGSGRALGRGEGSINRFIFKGHWTLAVNGVVYDPIFRSINEDNVATTLDYQYKGDGGRFLANTGRPVPSGEFGATFVHVTDWDTFAATVTDMTALYKKSEDEVEDILAGRKTAYQKPLFGKKKPRTSVAAAKSLVATRVPDPATFAEAVAAGTTVFTGSQLQAIPKVLALAGM